MKLAELSTFGIGGEAKHFLIAKTVQEMQEAVCSGERLLIVGKGSNCLFDDEGFDGLVVLNKIDFLNQEGSRFEVGSGSSFAYLGIKTARMGFAGLEFASGIPGSVGGAVTMNAGANGSETADHLIWVEAVMPGGKLRRFARSELDYSYRSSPFQKEGVVVAAAFELEKVEGARKRQLALLAKRKETQPVGEKCAGCIFRNPEGGSAGKLIEEAGLKGKRVGDAEVSLLHGNFIVNRGNARAKEVLQLIVEIKEAVKMRTGVDLQEEVRYISQHGLSS